MEQLQNFTGIAFVAGILGFAYMSLCPPKWYEQGIEKTIDSISKSLTNITHAFIKQGSRKVR